MPLIAIVDARATNRHGLARLAESIGPDVTVRSFEEPLAALAWFAETVPDLVVADSRMPHLDGAELTRRLHASRDCGEVPVLIVESGDEPQSRLCTLEAGAADVLRSPLDHAELVARARNLLKRRKRQLALRSQAERLERELEASERRRERELRDSRERLGQIIDTMPAMVSASDRRGRCVFLNACHAASHGIDSTDVSGKSTAAILGKARAERERKLDRLVFETRKALPSFEEEFVDRDGDRRVLLTTKSPLRDLAGDIVNVVTTSLDITDRKRAERHLLHLAHHDALTDLPNRTLLAHRLAAQLDSARLNSSRFALHFLDLDNFKSVNDVLGHAIGDRLLAAVAEKLRTVVGEGDTVARLGGDEFAVLQAQVGSADEAAELARRAIEAVSQPIDIEGAEIRPAVSVGITLFPDDGRDAEALLKSADCAMYQAKAAGGGGRRFYSAEVHTLVVGGNSADAPRRAAAAGF